MANERNVAALRKLVGEWCAIPETEKIKSPGGLSDFLAARGVLVPSALTDDEAGRAAMEGTIGFECEPEPSNLRAELERIAKGDA